MTITDKLYGSLVFPEWFEKILNSPLVTRLEKIHQSGAVFLVDPKISHKRLEHSIGVMMLIKVLGGSELEQLAGLLHDVSHTAFSHVGDYVLGYENENYHDQIYKEYVLSSDVPSLLKEHNYEVNDLFDQPFSLLEQDSPFLCADRLDYTLRDAYYAGLASFTEVKNLLGSLTVREGKISISDYSLAQWLDELSARLHQEVFLNPLYNYASYNLALIIKEMMASGKLQEADLMKNDTQLLNKIRSYPEGLAAIKSIIKQTGFADFERKISFKLPIKTRLLKAT